MTYVAWFSFRRMTRKCIVRQAGTWESKELTEMRQGKSRQGSFWVCKAMTARDYKARAVSVTRGQGQAGPEQCKIRHNEAV